MRLIGIPPDTAPHASHAGRRLLLLALALALPLAVSLASSPWLTRHALGADVDRLAEASARCASSILDEGRRTRGELDATVAGDCGPRDKAMPLEGLLTLLTLAGERPAHT